MALSDFPRFIRQNYELHEWRYASAILKTEYPEEWDDIVKVLTRFRLYNAHILAGGGNKTKVAALLDDHFNRLGWHETKFDTRIQVTELEVLGRHASRRIGVFEMDSPTHQVDEYKNDIAVEVEWNNKDPFYDRDLNNFRLLFDLRVISVGVIITRTTELQGLFNELGIGRKYGQNTTHMGKLLPRLEGGSGGGCPVLVFGITPELYSTADAPVVIETPISDDEDGE